MSSPDPSHRGIALGGHFAIGEVMYAGHRATMAAAAREGVDLGILVDDVGVKEKVWHYLHGGKARLVESYRDRWQCAQRSCLRSYLPPPTSAPQVIDDEQLDFIVSQLGELVPEGLRYLERMPLASLSGTDRDLFTSVNLALRRDIVPQIVARRVAGYGLPHGISYFRNRRRLLPGVVNIFSEQHLIGIVTKRTRSRYRNKEDSWRQLNQIFYRDPRSRTVMMGIEEVVSEHGSPLCRGIMLALYQELGRAGYSHVFEHYLWNSRVSVAGAQGVYSYIGRRFPFKRDWRLTFRSAYYSDDGDVLPPV